LQRIYFTCNACLSGSYTGDLRLGVEGAQTTQARRLICLAATSWSFAGAERHLREFCGWQVSRGTIRNVADSQAKRVDSWQIDAPTARQKFRETSGEIEFLTDGTCVNTDTGWREMRVGIFTKRALGEPAPPESWDQRQLPAPSARYAFAAIESSADFTARWPQVASRLGIRSRDRIDVLADGARWIWDGVELHWANADGALDVFHALEHVAQTAQALYGEGSQPAQRWNDRARDTLLAHGWPGMSRLINESRVDAVRAPQREAVAALERYLTPHADRLRYAQRLAEGRAIGSGLVEGACKQLVGRRLKQTGARWKVLRVNRMANLCALLYNQQWDTYWDQAA
jgi:hypothetical protein